MDTQRLGPGVIEKATVLTGGTQNLLLAFERGGRRYVLRRPPLYPQANSNDTMRREMRVLQALADQDVPHPRLIAACPETDVLGASFYLMEPIEGFNLSMGMPALHAGDPAIRRRMGFAFVDGIVRLGRVDHAQVGLGDFGRSNGFLERQVRRWRSQLEAYQEYPGWPGPQVLPGVERISDWLERHRPVPSASGILHGDYHLANVLFRNDGPGLAAIVDWELVTIGDPLVDLGWVLTMWPRSDDPTSMKIEPWEGFPAPNELLEYYRDGSNRDLSAIPWYVVLACYKLGILLEGTNARACAGKAVKDLGDRFHRRSVALFERALSLI
jgi:aminoglycoside phosphotransferase (APT) family kinase protein